MCEENGDKWCGDRLSLSKRNGVYQQHHWLMGAIAGEALAFVVRSISEAFGLWIGKGLRWAVNIAWASWRAVPPVEDCGASAWVLRGEQ